MGSGTLFVNRDTNEIIHSQKIKPTESNPSSTKAEIVAIYSALKVCPKNLDVNIYSDSQSALSNLNKMKEMNKSNYRKL